MSQVNCRFGLDCRNKATCRFSHVVVRNEYDQKEAGRKAPVRNEKTKPCTYFSQPKGCKNGDACTFLHVSVAQQAPHVLRNRNPEADAYIREREAEIQQVRDRQQAQQGRAAQHARKPHYLGVDPTKYNAVMGEVMCGNPSAAKNLAFQRRILLRKLQLNEEANAVLRAQLAGIETAGKLLEGFAAATHELDAQSKAGSVDEQEE